MAGRYIAPADPFSINETACLMVFYPDEPFFRRALHGQLTELERRHVWDTGGDLTAANKCEELWRQHGQQTRENEPLGCQSDEDCQQTIIDLTLQLEQCQEYIEELENMEITVNCNCGCCSDGIQLPNPNGYPCTPLDPQDPFGDNVPTWDYVNETPPPGYDDWQSFLDDRCRAANWFVDSYIQMVESLDLAERKLSIGGSLLEVAALVIAALPGPVGDWAGVAVVLKWVVALVDALANVVDDLEDLGDWLQTTTDAIEANKQELICAAYSMTTVDYLKDFFVTFFAGYVSPELASAGYNSTVTDFMRDAVTPLAEYLANKVADGFANQNIPDDYVPSYDCANCAAGDVFVRSYGNGSVIEQELALNIGATVLMTAHRSDAYGPFMELRMVDDQGTPIHLEHQQLRIVELIGWQQHNIPQHPFTIQTKQQDGSNNLVDLPINTAIPVPHDISRASDPLDIGIVEIASNVGTSGFQVRLLRVF